MRETRPLVLQPRSLGRDPAAAAAPATRSDELVLLCRSYGCGDRKPTPTNRAPCGRSPSDDREPHRRQGGAGPAREQAMARTVRAVRGRADRRPRRDDRERRAAIDQARSRVLTERSRMGAERVPDRVRGAAAAGRSHRRPHRPAASVPDGSRRFHGRVGDLRSGAEPGGPDRGALRPGHRRCPDLRGDPGHDRDDVSRAEGTGEGDRRLWLRRLGRRFDRAARRRHPYPGGGLALDLLHQPPDRGRDCPPRDQVDRRL
jgi:hypothetical protein